MYVCTSYVCVYVCVYVNLVLHIHDRRKECLRHFVVILTELQQLKLLCHLTYPGMEEEVCNLHEWHLYTCAYIRTSIYAYSYQTCIFQSKVMMTFVHMYTCMLYLPYEFICRMKWCANYTCINVALAVIHSSFSCSCSVFSHLTLQYCSVTAVLVCTQLLT